MGKCKGTAMNILTVGESMYIIHTKLMVFEKSILGREVRNGWRQTHKEKIQILLLQHGRFDILKAHS
jgi:hypothetical protein